MSLRQAMKEMFPNKPDFYLLLVATSVCSPKMGKCHWMLILFISDTVVIRMLRACRS